MMPRQAMQLAWVTLCALCVPGLALAQVNGPTVIEPAFQGQSPPLTELAAAFAANLPLFDVIRDEEIPNPEVDLRAITRQSFEPKAGIVGTGDPARQTADGTGGTTPLPSLSFEGASGQDNADVTGGRPVPPDTEGDIGEKFYVQSNNNVFKIFDKSTGALVLGPLPNNIFYAGTGGSFCEINNDGDPIVLYDHQEKRWIFSQLAIFEFDPDLGVFVAHECFAVSATADPLGAYHLYDFVTAVPQFAGGLAALNDYPKLAIWPDGIYYTANDFELVQGGFQLTNASAIAFDKQAMYAGDPAVGIQFKIGPLGSTNVVNAWLLPSHWEGETPPEQGTPNTFWQLFDSEQFTFDGSTGPDGVLHWDFVADFDTPLSSQFIPRGLIEFPEVESFVCSGAGRNCVDQPSPGTIAEGQGIDTIDFRLMFRAQFRRFGDDEDSDSDSDGDSDSDSDSDAFDAVVLSGTVDADGDGSNGVAEAGVRWAELRNHGSGWSLHQAGTFAPQDGEQRFMGSIAQNKRGDIALGYTVSSAETFPSVRYTTRRANDPLGEMTGTEVSCFEGSGSQIDSAGRWGDYSTMSVDPEDDCTFWYTNEYYEVTGSRDFKTRICRFNPCDDDEDSDSDD